MNFKQKTSVEIPHWFMQNNELTSGEKIVLLSLFFFMEDYKADVYASYIAELSSQSRQMTYRYLNQLEKKGFITIEKTKNPNSPKMKILTNKGIKLIDGYYSK